MDDDKILIQKDLDPCLLLLSKSESSILEEFVSVMNFGFSELWISILKTERCTLDSLLDQELMIQNMSENNIIDLGNLSITEANDTNTAIDTSDLEKSMHDLRVESNKESKLDDTDHHLIDLSSSSATFLVPKQSYSSQSRFKVSTTPPLYVRHPPPAIGRDDDIKVLRSVLDDINVKLSCQKRVSSSGVNTM